MTATVIIVNYRAYAELQPCLASLAKYEPDARVVVIDHAADLEQASRLSAAFPRVAYRATHDNPGFGAGVNTAAREAGAGPLLLLNPDCELTMPVIGPLVSVLEHDASVGVVGGLVRESDGTVQASARRFPDATTGVAGRTSWLSKVAPGNRWTRRNLTTDPSTGLHRVDWVSGALMLIRREAFDAIGGFDERFFLYCEDVDLCHRLRDAGHEVRYEPGALARHVGGASAPRGTTLPIYARSRVLYARKHYRRPAVAVERVGVAIGELTHALVSLARPAKARAHVLALQAVIRPVPRGGGA
jgi:GT2 family glycosyltransferase